MLALYVCNVRSEEHTDANRFYYTLMNTKHSLFTITESESATSVHLSNRKVEMGEGAGLPGVR